MRAAASPYRADWSGGAIAIVAISMDAGSRISQNKVSSSSTWGWRCERGNGRDAAWSGRVLKRAGFGSDPAVTCDFT